MDSQFIIANITWNDFGWRNVYKDSRAGHRYARNHPGHESLNFDFNKKHLDSPTTVYGYIQWTNSPKTFVQPGVIFFFSKNLTNSQNEIIGVYGNARILKHKKVTRWPGFENDTLLSNIEADKGMSLLFSIPLAAELYSHGKRLVPQVGFTYIDVTLAKKIICDEIEQLKIAGSRKEEYDKLSKLFYFATGETYEDGNSTDECEQRELEEQTAKDLATEETNREEMIKELEAIKPTSSDKVEYRGKTYKRDNKTIAMLKILRYKKCQVCKEFIVKKNGDHYVEAAHIKPKKEKGPETPDNILILCPNHHKEFDLGDTKVINHTKEEIVFKLNGTRYELNLSLH